MTQARKRKLGVQPGTGSRPDAEQHRTTEKSECRSLWGSAGTLGNGGTTGVCWNETT